MHLPANQRSILAYFPSWKKAQQTAQSIRDAGLISDPGSIQVDSVHRYSPAGMDHGGDSPINQAATLSGVTIYSSSSGPDGANPLLAASPSASGFDNPHGAMPQNKTVLLTVVLNEDQVVQTVDMIKRYGGSV